MTLKVMDNGLCAFKGLETIEAARAEMLEMVYTYTIDELPFSYTVEDETTGEVVETHCFDLEHHTHEGECI